MMLLAWVSPLADRGPGGFVAERMRHAGRVRTKISRRGFLATAAAATLAACTESSPATPMSSATAATSTTTPPTTGPPDLSALSTQIKGRLLRPNDAGYAAAAQVYNPRFDSAAPLAVAQVASADDVAAALGFAKANKVPLALRAGGHCYPGWSAGGAPGTGVPPSLVIDVAGLNTISVDKALGVEGHAARIGAGTLLIDAYRQLAAAGVGIPAGSCPSVGITGLTLGGGIGVLSRAWGLTCDALTAVQIVTADGVVRSVDRQHDPDLFWACQGGGGGQFGVVTQLTFATRPAPRITTFYLEWSWSAAATVLDAWQQWMAQADPQLWSTLKLLVSGGHTVVRLAGTWLGTTAELDSVLDRLASAVGAAPSTRSTQDHSYLDAMLLEAGCTKVGATQCYLAPKGALQREALSATSHLGTHPLDSATIGVVTAQVEKALTVSGVVEAGVSFDALGGEVSTVANADSAFGYRDALFSLQYTATYTDTARADTYDAYVRGFRAAMLPHLGNTAYVNYADAAIEAPQQAYFAANAARLGQIKKRYDPDGLFTQPQSV